MTHGIDSGKARKEEDEQGAEERQQNSRDGGVLAVRLRENVARANVHEEPGEDTKIQHEKVLREGEKKR